MQKREKTRRKNFEPSVSVADASINVSTYKGKDTVPSSNRYRYSTGDNEPTSAEKKDTGANNTEYIKDIGRRGEEYVLRILQDEYKDDSNIEIRYLNSEGQTGIGADFEIKQDGIVIKIIEVKSTTNPKGSPLIVSGTQWETAREFYKLDDGDKYWIYCVYNVGKEYVQVEKVQNPIKQWKDGKLEAHPINFVFK